MSRRREVYHAAVGLSERLYTIAQAAKAYRYHPVAVKRLIGSGRLKVWAREGRIPYILESECARVLKRGHS